MGSSAIKTVCGVALVGSGVMGCNNPCQGAWLDAMVHARVEVDDAIWYGGAPIETSRLIEVAGELDLRAPFGAIVGRVKGDTADYRGYVNRRLQGAFDRYKGQVARRHARGESPISLTDCDIWLYDESKRLRRPYRTSAKVGFSAYPCLVWDSRVIGMVGATHWHGLGSE